MLPRLPKLAEDYWAVNQAKLRAAVREVSPVLNSIPHVIFHEGKGSTIKRADGSIGAMETRAASSELELKKEDFNRFDAEVVTKNIKRMAEDFAKGGTELMFETIEKSSQASGNVVDGANRPFHEAMLDAMERISPNLDGEAPFMVVPPDVAEKMFANKERLDRDPEVQERLRKIFFKQEGERRARKANRRLVG